MVPYKECKQGQEPQEFDETKLAPKKFIEKECTQTKKEIPHKKLLPECRNVTKQNCVTNWETDSYGNQVLRISFQPLIVKLIKPQALIICLGIVAEFWRLFICVCLFGLCQI